MSKIPISTLFILLVYSCFLDATNHRFESFSIERGLAGRLIRDITQDQQGFIWLATANGLSRYDGYQFKNFYHDSKNNNSLSSNDIWRLHIDQKGVLWVVTRLGVDQYSGKNFVRFSPGTNTEKDNTKKTNIKSNNRPTNRIYSIHSDDSGIFLGTQKGILYKSFERSTFTQLPGIKEAVYFLLTLPDNAILAATESGLYLKKADNNDFEQWPPSNNQQLSGVRNLHLDQQNNLWLATTTKLFKTQLSDKYLSNDKKILEEVFASISQHQITRITSDENSLWIGTLKNGLYKVSQDNSIENFKYNAQLQHSIQDNVIASLFIDSSKTLWAGTFNSGVAVRNQNVNAFELYQPGLLSLPCLKSRIINQIHQDKAGNLYLGSGEGLYKINIKNNLCVKIELSPNAKSQSIAPAVYSFYESPDDLLYIGSSVGLFQYDPDEQKAIPIAREKINASVYFIHPIDEQFLIGTHTKTYLHDPNNSQTYELNENSTVTEVGSFLATQFKNNQVLLASTKGLIKYDSKKGLSLFKPDGHQALNSLTNTILVDKKSIWLGNNDKHFLYQFNHQGDFIGQYPLSKEISSIKPLAILDDGNNLWISSNKGLFQLEKESQLTKKYVTIDGLQSDVFIRNAAYRAADGKIYLGGRNGFNAFYPDHIKTNNEPPKVVMTELRRFNTIIEPNTSKDSLDGFSIKSPIESLQRLDLSYRDYVISLEFTALHFAAPAFSQYAYKIEGLHNDWIETNANNRRASLTNLTPGDYLFRVKAATKDGVWSLPENEVKLPIKVYPAPWFSWWAYVLYVTLLIFAIFWFIRYRTRAAVKHAQDLEKIVTKRTKEVVAQKNLIESLLEYKNKLFANISHEFRTPLTLIIGPTEKELKTIESPKNPKRLQMIQRNAIRLLGMVEQILKLTELEKERQLKKFPHSIKPIICSLFDSFLPLAESRQIQLNLQSFDDCNVMVSKDGLEIMIGNLISNAIKYSHAQGTVDIILDKEEGYINIMVKDTGVGMTEAQTSQIFERFVRLNKTSDIAGSGIGLSIVKELALANEGKISVTSSEDVGSIFTLSLPVTNEPAATKATSLSVINHLTNVESSLVPDSTSSPSSDLEIKESVLIIEDNPDMQEFITSVLASHYHCLNAINGEDGIEIAISRVPDLIICDVMMPHMDGYQVVNQLRRNEITAHIPIILLTAKGDKASRIQGWNENIDDYMTKPFDETELLARIKNILSIRDILKHKLSQQITLPPQLNQEDSADKSIRLNSLDKQFVSRLISQVEKNFADHHFNSNQMASALGVSPRQLQRKLSALIDKSPMDILRQYRLKKASELIQGGYQVGVVADKCGFSSQSYFTQCFKAEYGMTPKQHRQQSESAN